ncbi:hypothetical protein JCM10213v2_009186 [Rhodosporidiobolus nylandii]
MAPSPSLPTQIRTSFSASLAAEHITLYAAEHVSLATDDPRGLTQFVHVVPQLAEKPAVPPSTPDLSKIQEGKRDVFAGPEFGEGEKICDLWEPADEEPADGEQGEEGEGKERRMYSLVHNLHALFPVPYEFRPQTSDLLPSDLAVAWRVVKSYAEEGREAVCFFNGGPLAGASQAHLHLQFTPFQHSLPPACEALARSLPYPPPSPSSTSSPSSDLARSEKLAARLPVPWVHFYLPLPSCLTSSSSASSSSAREALFETYQTLLATRTAYLSTLPESALPPAGPKRESYNLFLTSSFMHLVPRTDRLVRVPRISSLSSASEGEEGEEDKEFTLSVNGLLFLSYFFVASPEEAEDLRSYGLGRTLRGAGYANEEYREEGEGGNEGVRKAR